MRRVVIVLAFALCLTRQAAAQSAVLGAALEAESRAFNEKVHAELKAANPEAEALLTEADAARERDDHEAAAGLYAKVFEMAPTFVTALRRQAGCELRAGKRIEAIQHASRAVQMVRDAENLTTLAMVVSTQTEKITPSKDEILRADQLAQDAVKLDPDNLYALLMLAGTAGQGGDVDGLDKAVEGLRRLLPDAPETHYFRTIALLYRGDFDGADAAADSARKAGLSDDAYTPLKEEIAKARPVLPRITHWGLIIGGAWISGAIVLLVAGVILSAMTLGQSGRVPADPNAGPTHAESALRQLYRLVIAASCVYYYISLPIILAVVLLAGGGIIWGMLSVGHVFIKLLFMVVIATLVTAWAILKSIFVRGREYDPGERLDLAGEPEVKGMLVDVASRVGTRPVDTVFMTPGTDVAVFERGGMMRQLAGKSERCLILGTGVLDGMKLRPLQAVLAHEYGHFSNRDTAGGGLALGVRRSLLTLAHGLAAGGSATWYNPAWWFVNGFHRLFLRISQGASRLQEVLADRWAALLYGAQSFEDGLRHVIDRSVRFNAHINATVQEVVDTKRPLANLYQYQPTAKGDSAAIDGAVKAAIEREPSPYDSHPCPLDRFKWVHALETPPLPGSGEDVTAWSLFRERDAIELRMTAMVRRALAENHGLQIAAG